MLKERVSDALKEDRFHGNVDGELPGYIMGTSNHTYKGVNKILLQYLRTERGQQPESRFYTFNQVKNMGLHLDETAKGKWYSSRIRGHCMHRENKKTISSEDYEKIKKGRAGTC